MGILTIFSDFRALVAAVRELVDVLEVTAGSQRELGPAISRVEALELHRAHFEAEMQGMLLKADGKLKAAANAEARERQLKKSYERDVDPLDPDSEQGSERIPAGDAAAGEAERVPPLRLDVAPLNGKALALRAKFGV